MKTLCEFTGGQGEVGREDCRAGKAGKSGGRLYTVCIPNIWWQPRSSFAVLSLESKFLQSSGGFCLFVCSVLWLLTGWDSGKIARTRQHTKWLVARSQVVLFYTDQRFLYQPRPKQRARKVFWTEATAASGLLWWNLESAWRIHGEMFYFRSTCIDRVSGYYIYYRYVFWS